jgi:Emfourin
MAVKKPRGKDPAPEYRVTVVRHGGFAGVPLTFEKDGTGLPPRRAAEFRRVVEASGIAAGRPDVLPRRAPQGRDLVEWEITVNGPGAAQTCRLSEDSAGPAIAKLIAFVLKGSGLSLTHS